MDRKPLVSVIIAFLNAEKFIQEAIESVFAQTYDHWELFLVDDGSTDNSTAIAREYAENYPAKMRYLDHDGHQNRGVCASRNLGIYHSKGQYIAILDADDVWLPHKLERQVEILDSHPKAGMVYGASEYWNSWTGKPEDAQRDFVPEFGVQTNTLFDPPTLLILCHPLGEGAAPCPSSLLLRREIVEHIGGFEEDFRGMYQLYEDQAFLIKVYLSASVFVANECWDRYRLHVDSCMARTNHQHHSIRLFFLNWLVEYLSKQEVKYSEVWNALRKALWPYEHPILHRLLSLPKKLTRLMKGMLKPIKQRLFPAAVYDWLRTQWKVYTLSPRVGSVDFGSLRRVKPISRRFGYDRGLPIDRYYIESFLARQANDILGRVLEIGDDSYTRRFGGSRVTVRDVFHVTKGNPNTTFIGDLTTADHIPSDTFDCIILTQTLDLIYDVRAALKTLYRILKPSGTVLATAPGISPIGHDEWTKHLCWSFTTMSARRLFEEVFPAANVKVETFGNVLVAIAFLHGLAAEELSQDELDYRDRHYEVLIAVRAVKPKGTQ